MPAMTSALTALRFSGRLMVIQRLDPRFSTRTLEVSVMVVSSRSHAKRLDCFVALLPWANASRLPQAMTAKI
jgi:hypothetical protein